MLRGKGATRAPWDRRTAHGTQSEQSFAGGRLICIDDVYVQSEG